MAVAVIMPKQGQSVEACIITEWFKKKGDKVAKGDVLFSYETDKASFEETAQEEGILLDTFFEEGDEVSVLENVAAIGQAGESADGFKPGGSETSESKPQAEEKVEDIPLKTETKIETEIPEPVQQTQSSGDKFISPRAKNLADKKGIDYNLISGTGPKGRIIERDILANAETAPRLTPLAQQVAQEKGLSAPSQGSGVGGWATVSDLSATSIPGYGGDFTDEKLSNIRKIISKNMHASLQNSAQLTHHMSADARNILALRKKVKKVLDGGYGYNITLNDMICFAVIKALKNKPFANVHFLGDSIRKFKTVHLGIAVDTERGLMVPALRNASDLNIQGLSSQLKALADSCKKGSVDPEALASTAATFTVSNLGSFGVEMFTPVINLPQAGILGVNTIIQRPGDVGGGVIGFIPYLGISLTYDHRVLDGAPASDFLREIKLQIENLDFEL